MADTIRRFGPLWFIPGDNNGKYPHCHSLYIEGAGVLIDPASNRRILTELRDSVGVKEVWLSHWHEDHFMHLDLFDDLPLSLHECDAPALASLDAILDWYGLEPDEEMAVAFRPMLVSMFHFRPRRPARTFRGGEVLQLGPVTVEILHVPGHTPGKCAYWFREPEVLFLGDYDLTKFGPYYGDPAASIEETVASVERLRQIPARKWLASHEQGVFEEAPAELWERYLGVIAERERKLLSYLAEPRTLSEILAQWIVYRKPREPLIFYAYAERAIVEKHLEQLIAQGEVCRQGQRLRAAPPAKLP